MNKIFLFISAIAITFTSTAQTIPGGDMETWRTGSAGTITVTAPSNWYGDDSIIIGLGQTYGSLLGAMPSSWERNLFREDVNVHSGSHAAKIMTMVEDTLLIPGVLTTAQTHIGITFIPTPGITGVSFSGGDPLTVKPTTVSAWVQYFPGKDSTGATGIDSGVMNVQALSLIGGKDSVIGTGTVTIGANSSWVQVTVNVNYPPADSTHPIDTMRITFTSSKGGSALDSSTLYVDDVTMTSTANPVNGVKIINPSEMVRVYPNPATGKLYFNTSGNPGMEAVIYSISGQVATEKFLTGYDAVDVSQLPSGFYFYSVFDKNGAVVQRGKVSVNN